MTGETWRITINQAIAGYTPFSRAHVPISIIGAPSSIGIKPYDDGRPRHVDAAPNALREQGLVARLRARDRGDVLPPPYRDLVRPPGRTRNESEVASYARALAAEVSTAVSERDFVLTLGGDCSIVLGCLLGVTQAKGRVALVYLDGHADFATPEISRTGSAASMCLALAVGRGATPLAHVGGAEPLVRGEDVVLIGRRDDADAPYGQDALSAHSVLDLSRAVIRERGTSAVAQTALARLTGPGVRGFWIHVDADVLDPSLMPAVDSPEPNGLSATELADLLRPLVRHPAALGLEITIYDPALDPDRTSAACLADVIETVLANRNAA